MFDQLCGEFSIPKMFVCLMPLSNGYLYITHHTSDELCFKGVSYTDFRSTVAEQLIDPKYVFLYISGCICGYVIDEDILRKMESKGYRAQDVNTSIVQYLDILIYEYSKHSSYKKTQPDRDVGNTVFDTVVSCLALDFIDI